MMLRRSPGKESSKSSPASNFSFRDFSSKDESDRNSPFMSRKGINLGDSLSHKIVEEEIREAEDEDSSGEEDETKTTVKDRQFEFSDGYGVMRLIRMMLFLQILAILIDNPTITVPIMFRIVSRGLLFYSIRFYSRPFIDLVYVIQYFFKTIVNFIESQKLPGNINNIQISRNRFLSSNSSYYNISGNTSIPISFPTISPSTFPTYSHGFLYAKSLSSNTFIVSFTNDSNWHTIKYYSHYILGILFIFMSVLFTIRLWEIKDYTNREEVRNWLKKYIADGWWRRGGLNIAYSMMEGYLCMAIVVFLIYAISQQFSNSLLPPTEFIGATFMIFISVVVIIWLLGYIGINITEGTFVRYVSQNVSYTSQIILKRAIKAKVELGLFLMSIIFTPVLYTLMQSMIVITDWNKTSASSFRKTVTFHIPCYYMAFPPYEKQFIAPDTCSVQQFSSIQQPSRTKEFYNESNIIQCDTYLGISVFVFSTLMFSLVLVGYFSIFYFLNHLVVTEFKASKFVDVLEKLYRIYDEEVRDFKGRFSFVNRTLKSFNYEVQNQIAYQVSALKWLFLSFFHFIIGIIKLVVYPTTTIFYPFWYLGKTIITITCLNYFTSEAKNKRSQDLKLIKNKNSKKYKKIRLADDNESVSTDATKELNNNKINEIINAASGKLVKGISRRTNQIVRSNKFLIFLKVIVTKVITIFSGDENSGLASVGGTMAPWRFERTLDRKHKLITRMRKHSLVELRSSKLNFITEHELFISSVFDYTIDSAGLTLLMISFDYHRMYWFILVLFELSIFAVAGAVLNMYVDWTTRNIIFILINIFFWILSYVMNPYTEELDRWLEYTARIMIIFISVGIIITSNITPAYVASVNAIMYQPWKNFDYLTSFWKDLGLYQIIDLLMVLYMYVYIIYILYVVGFFGVVQRKFRNLIFTFHDKVVDFLVEQTDTRRYGLENIYTGLSFIQQWDEIIKIQRRYAFLSWPDVRPQHLVSFVNKIFEIKWASLFNMTLNNIRSSLGLTILHTAMFSGNSEAVMWLLHTNGELLKVIDSQNDNPLSIALKECAYFLLAYGQQNDGNLEDGSSYDDEYYNIYYPEVEEIREEIFQRGEFIEDRCNLIHLTEKDLISLKEEGYHIEAPPPRNPFLNSGPVKTDIYGNKKYNQEQSEFLKKEKRDKRREKRVADKLFTEKKSLHSVRFPEDEVPDNMESGQLNSWQIVGLSVPDVNLFMDKFLFKKMEKDNSYKYDNYSLFEGDEDLRYVIPTMKKTLHCNQNLVPLNHPGLKEFTDWDKRRRRNQSARRSSVTSELSKPDTADSSDDNSSIRSGGSSNKDNPLKKTRHHTTERETRFKICKFAEILFSAEINRTCHDMVWNVNDFKEYAKMSSLLQGKIVQNLVMVCNFNVPPGFTRISDWHTGYRPIDFDEPPENKVSLYVKGAVNIVSATDKAVSVLRGVINTAVSAVDIRSFINSSTSKGRGRRNRSRSSFLSSQDDGKEKKINNKYAFSDRIIQYLAEAVVCTQERVQLVDCELSYNGKNGWRAIARALRRKYCNFISPSIYVPPKPVLIRYLELPKNELDCGDAVYIADIIINQTQLIYLDLSHNKIGARGMARMCKALRENKSIVTFRIDHNIIGPTCGRDIGVWLKNSSSIKVLTLSYNRLGEIMRYPTLFSKEKIESAVNDIFLGIRFNRSLEQLDISYNHLGPRCATAIPVAICRHPYLHTLNISGNDIGADRAAHFIFALAGLTNGVKMALQKEKFVDLITHRYSQNLNVDEKTILADLNESYEDAIAISKNPMMSNSLSIAATNSIEFPNLLASKSKDSFEGIPEPSKAKVVRLASLSLADNQLGPFSGYAIAALIENNKFLTHLDISGNFLSHKGGDIISDQLELCHGIKPRDFVKTVLWDMEERKYTGRDAIPRKKVYTNLTSLDMSRNGFGPRVIGSLMTSLGNSNCSITDLNISDNPLGYSTQAGGMAVDAGVDMRYGLANSQSLKFIDISRTSFFPLEMVPFFGGLANNNEIMKLIFQDIEFDEPSCLQLCTALGSCDLLSHLDLRGCKIGSNGSIMIASKIRDYRTRFKYIDLTGIRMGPNAALYISNALSDPKCKISNLYIARNDIMEEGGVYIAKALSGNLNITDIDLSDNSLGYRSAIYMSDVIKGLYKNGKKINDCNIKCIKLNNNPEIGANASKMLIRCLANNVIEHLEIANIGALVGCAKIISLACRDPGVAWKYCDFSGNNFTRSGLNQIFWAMRHNKRMRVLKCSDNKAGPAFASNTDALLSHGIALVKTLHLNVVLRELDLSYNGLSTEAAVNIFDAMIDNHTIRKLSLRGNIIDDNLSVMIPDFLRCNNVVEELDLGYNQIGFACAYAFAESLEINRSLKVLVLDYNKFASAGHATLDSFTRAVMLNGTLEVLVLDGNKLGPEWGVRLAEVIARNFTLKQFSLRDNRFDSRAGRALLNAYRRSPYLLELALSGDEVGQEIWEGFKIEFDKKRASIHPHHLKQETKISKRQLKILDSYTF